MTPNPPSRGAKSFRFIGGLPKHNGAGPMPGVQEIFWTLKARLYPGEKLRKAMPHYPMEPGWAGAKRRAVPLAGLRRLFFPIQANLHAMLGIFADIWQIPRYGAGSSF